MSGIYIRGMEMPTSCDMCWALDEYGDYPRCRITEEQRGYNFPVREQRMSHCPIVPVPEHGDLIDKQVADELNRLDYEAMGSDKYTDYARGVVLNALNAAPIAIPADKEDE